MSENYDTRLTLLAKVKNQYDDQSWENFTYYYKRYIQMVVLRLGVFQNEVDDVSQKVLLTLWDKLPDFQYKPGECKFRTWMNQVIRNVTMTHFRGAVRYKNRLEKVASFKKDEFELPDIYEAIELNWKAHISNLAWENISQGLSARSKECFLYFADGMPADKVAEKMGIKLNSAYIMKKRVVEKISREIRRLEIELS